LALLRIRELLVLPETLRLRRREMCKFGEQPNPSIQFLIAERIEIDFRQQHIVLSGNDTRKSSISKKIPFTCFHGRVS
jgi:hypothetical protein